MSEIAALGVWLREVGWPAWLQHGVDWGRGGFFEALDLDSKQCVAPFRRLRVVARQIYVFSKAHQACVAGAGDAVRLGLAFLRQHAAQRDGGYAWRFDLAHQPIDMTRDLYDHAFVLLALASAVAVEDRAVLRAEALAVLAYIDREFPHEAGGYLESLPPALPRRQNPHMHFLEALLAAYAAFDEPVFLQRAAAVVDLFVARLWDSASGALPEYFDQQLAPVLEDGVFLVEPGHHCEWVWLLHWARRLGVADARMEAVSRRLMQFVDAWCVDPVHGGIFDGVDSSGRVRDKTARLWPQTERLKAEFLRADADAGKQRQAARALLAYLRPDGLWHERRDAAGQWVDQPAPASSLYHVTAAILVVEGVGG